MKDKSRGKGKPFTKNDPRRSRGGRPKKSTSWKAAEVALRQAIPKILMMPKDNVKELLNLNPTGAEMLAAKYIHEHAIEAVNRFLGRVPTELTGKDGTPLIPKPVKPVLPPINFAGWKPKQIDAFIEATKAK